MDLILISLFSIFYVILSTPASRGHWEYYYLSQQLLNSTLISVIFYFFFLHGYCTREIKMRIAIAKDAFNRKMSLLTSKVNIEPKKKLVTCYVWSIALYGSETWTLRKLVRKYLESFEMWC